MKCEHLYISVRETNSYLQLRHGTYQIETIIAFAFLFMEERRLRAEVKHDFTINCQDESYCDWKNGENCS